MWQDPEHLWSPPWSWRGCIELIQTSFSAMNHNQLLAPHRSHSQFDISAKQLITGTWLLVPAQGFCSHWGCHFPQQTGKEWALQPSLQPPHSMGLHSSSTAASCCVVLHIAWGQCHWQAWVLLSVSWANNVYIQLWSRTHSSSILTKLRRGSRGSIRAGTQSLQSVLLLK